MLRRPRSLAFTLAILSAVATTDATAQDDIASPFRFVEESQAIGPIGGYALTDEGTLDLGPEPAPVYGVRYAIRISGPFTAEGLVAYLPTQRTVYDPAQFDGEFEPLGEADLSLAILQAALRFNLTGPRTYYGFQPYILAGVGAATDVSGDEDAFRDELVTGTVPPQDVIFDFGTTFAAQVGAGIEWFATRRVTLSVDVRDLFWEMEAPAAFVEPDVGDEVELDVPTEEWQQNFLFQLGLSYRF